MSRITLLSENLANRIAAGEVVERPASIVKELVENAIDAGATRVEVELREGGRKLIKVIDNGGGMTPDELTLAVQRFATSKIRTEEDLDAIGTMGFRGEALPSIGAVSHLRLTSRPAHADAGAALTVHGGNLQGPTDTGCPPGTTVEVADLFYNTPARLKFLATTATERGHCVSWVQYLALSRPDIAFKVSHDGQVLFSTAGNGRLEGVLAALYGASTVRDFLPVGFTDDSVRIEGMISGPRLTRGSRRHQFLFVNRRYVKSRQLSHALETAYGMLLPAGKLPVCAVHFDLDPRDVDPNVHPTKIEVRFRTPGRLHEIFQQACEESLAAAGFRSLTHRPRPFALRGAAPAGRLPGPDADMRGQARRLKLNPFADSLGEREDGLEVFSPAPLKLPPPDRAAPGTQEADKAANGQAPAGMPGTVGDESAATAADTVGMRLEVLGQLGARYIVATCGEELYLVDQHRAAERVAFNRLRQAAARQINRQYLMVPETLELSPAEAAAVSEHQDDLLHLGFELEPFGTSAFVVRSVPADLAERGYETHLRALVDDLASWNAPSEAEGRTEELAALVACHTSIKAGERLTDGEMRRLVAELLATDTPAVCPHGDPVIVHFDGHQINRRFKRE